MTQIYKIGTVSVTNGSTTVTGDDTGWATALVTGGLFTRNGLSVPIESVEGENALTLALPWPGPSGSGIYAIMRENSAAASVVDMFDRMTRALISLSLHSIHPNAAGTLAERDALTLGAEETQFVFLRLETGQPDEYYRWGGAAWVGPFPVRGPAGADSTIPGPPGDGFNPAGAWDIGTTYDGGDFVSFGGRTFVSLADGNLGNEPPSADEDDANWMFVPTAEGAPGTPVELQVTATHIQWRYVGTPDWTDLIALSALAGADGWSPVLALVVDGARRVLQVADWVGGEGTKPATGNYVGASGLTPTIGDAIDIRGPSGSGMGDVTTAGSVTSDRIAVYADGTGDSIKDGGKTIAELLASAGAVSSVNGATGAVVLEADDINTTPSGPFGGDDVEAVLDDHDGRIVDLEGADIEVVTHAATSKATPADADEFALVDSEASFGMKKVTWANIKAGIWSALGALINGGTAKTIPVDADLLAIADSAASNASKKVTLTSLWANYLFAKAFGTENIALTGGATVTSKSLGTISSGTLTLDMGDRPLQHYTNNGAHTLAPGAVNGACLVDITNGASAGAITTSGWKVAGDSFTTTSGHAFRCHCSVGAAGSLLIVQALQ